MTKTIKKMSLNVPENTKDLSQFLTGKIEEPEQKTVNLRNRQ